MKSTNPIYKTVLLVMLPLFLFAACTEDGDVITLKTLELTKDAVEIGVNSTTSVDIFSGNGKYSVSSDNEQIAVASCNGETVIITGKSQGTAVITVKDELLKRTATVQVAVSALALSSDVQGVAFEDNRTFNVLHGSGSYEVTANPSDVITIIPDASDKTKFRIYGAKIGEATLTVTDKETNDKLQIPMLVCAPIDLEKGTLSVVVGESSTVNITAGSGSYAVESTNAALAVGSAQGDVATITGVAIGSVAVNIKDVVTGSQTSVMVNVTDNKISLVFYGGSSATKQEILINAPRLYRNDVWLDLNGNAIKDPSEAITVFEEDITIFPGSADVELYGKVTRLGRKSVGEGVAFNIEKADFSKNPHIKTIELNRGLLRELNVVGCTELERLYIANNSHAMTTLDVSTNTALKELYVSVYGGTTLDLSGLSDLKVLHTQDSENLTTIKFKNNTGLLELNCAVCPDLASISGLSECENLQYINTYNCGLTSIDLSQNSKLEYIYIGANPYTSPINLSSSNNLREFSIYLCNMSDANVQSTLNTIPNRPNVTKLHLWGNQIEGLDLTEYTSINEIECQRNKISDTKALALMESLPAREPGSKAFIIVADTSPTLEEGDENNHFSAAAVKIATDKNWGVYCINGGQKIPYFGK